MKILLILNDAPYGSEKVYNALRLAINLNKEHTNTKVRIFLMADSVTSAISNQITPQGYYNVERMLKSVILKGTEVKACGTCLDARGLKEIKLLDGIEYSNMSSLSNWVVDSDKVLTF